MNKHILKPQKNSKEIENNQEISFYGRKGQVFIFEHLTELTNENEITITAKIKINIDNNKGKRMIQKMIDKQESPIVTELKRMERDSRIDAEEKDFKKRYILPNEIIEKIK